MSMRFFFNLILLFYFPFKLNVGSENIFQLKFSKSKESNVTFLECDENNEHNDNGVH